MKFNKLEKIISKLPDYREDQVDQLIYKELISSWDNATTLPKGLRNRLKKCCPLKIRSNTLKSKTSKTEKVLVTLNDGEKIESVLMRYENRYTVCVSTQVGCAMGCKFCATGQMGFTRNLDVWEIVQQVIYFARKLKRQNERVSNIVFMGMGEPFLNYENVLNSIKIFNDEDKFKIGARNISISTCGIVEGIKMLANEPFQVNLAISLHAPNDELRTKLMPINKKYPIKKILNAVDKYIAVTNRKVMFEYVLLDKINDSKANARQLSSLLKDKLAVVNLIPANPVGKFKPSNQEAVTKFRKILENNNLEVVQRYSFGKGIKAACGQLATGR